MDNTDLKLIDELNRNGYGILIVKSDNARLLDMDLQQVMEFEPLESSLYLGLKDQLYLLQEMNEEHNAKKKYKKEINKLIQILSNREVFGADVDRNPDMSCIKEFTQY